MVHIVFYIYIIYILLYIIIKDRKDVACRPLPNPMFLVMKRYKGYGWVQSYALGTKGMDRYKGYGVPCVPYLYLCTLGAKKQMLNLEHSNAVKRESSMWAQLAHGLENCPVGQGFTLDLPEGSNVAAFRSKVSKKAKTLNKRFTVKRAGESTFQITRLEDEASQDSHIDVKFEYFPSTQSKPRADLNMQDVWALIQDLFMACPEGMSFAIRLGEDQMMLPKLKTMIIQKNQSHNRNFEVIAQPQGWFELMRREMSETYDVQPIGWTLENN